MLKNSLYIINSIETKNNFVEALVKLNAEHEIFKGHFPDQPVLPGACMLQMIKEIIELVLDKKLQLSKADEIKFLQMIQPLNNDLKFSIQYFFLENFSLKLTAKIITEEVVCCKMKALFQVKD